MGCVGTGLGGGVTITIWGCPPAAKGFGVLDAFPSSGVLWEMCGKSPSEGDPVAIAGAEIKALLVEFWFKSFSPKEHFGELSPTLQATTVPRTFWHVL